MRVFGWTRKSEVRGEMKWVRIKALVARIGGPERRGGEMERRRWASKDKSAFLRLLTYETSSKTAIVHVGNGAR